MKWTGQALASGSDSRPEGKSDHVELSAAVSSGGRVGGERKSSDQSGEPKRRAAVLSTPEAASQLVSLHKAGHAAPS